MNSVEAFTSWTLFLEKLQLSNEIMMTVTKQMTTTLMPLSRDDGVSLVFLIEPAQYIKGRLLSPCSQS